MPESRSTYLPIETTPRPTPGERFGPYDIVGPLGSGGMGVVYRARDPRLGRDVALKTLAPGSLGDATRLQRFEQEARAASALNHPNVLAVFDVGREGDTPFLVTELLEGQTLRERLAEGPLPPRKVIELALQAAQGLAAVHEKGIVHRDLKPENLFLTREGQLKILDFGVARTSESATPPTGTLPLTRSGAVMGTAGYMAPEQVRGQTADARSDLFALGAILHECLSGELAFPGETPVERAYAILNAEPKALPGSSPLTRIIARCLEKDPARRFQHARDFAFALEAIGDGSGPQPIAPPPRPASRLWWGVLLGAAGVSLAAGVVVISRPKPEPAPVVAPRPPVSSRRVSFRSGSIYNARFGADGRTVVYGASFENERPRVYAGVLDGPELREVGAAGTVLFDLSARGDVAEGALPEDTLRKEGLRLSRASLTGAAPRPLYDGVLGADFGVDDALVLIRFSEGRYVIEYPAGRPVLTTNHLLKTARLSPDHKHLAFERHTVRGDDRGTVEIADLTGKVLASSTQAWTLDGLAWAPSGQEVWFSAGYDSVSRQIYALSVGGAQRQVFAGPGSVRLMDIDAQGRLLIAGGITRSRMFGQVNGETKERSLSWLDGSMPLDLSADGKVMLFLEGYGPAGSEVQTWLRRFDRPDDTPVQLALGWGKALSPDTRWAVIAPTPPFNTLRLVPTGVGTQRDLPAGAFQSISAVHYFSDGERIAFSAIGADNKPHLFVQSVVVDATEAGASARPRQVSPEPLSLSAPPSPDGRLLVAVNAAFQSVLVDVDSGAVRPLPALAPGDLAIQWTPDGKSLWVLRRPLPFTGVGVELLRHELGSGKLLPFKHIEPPDPVGMDHLRQGVLSPDGKSYVYTVHQQLDELFLVEGVR